MPPRDGDGFIDEAGGKDDRQVCAPVEAHGDFPFRDGDVGRHIDEVAEDLASLSIAVSAHAVGHQAVEAGGDDEEGHVEVDLEADR